jgi:hypothetical protein
VGVVDDDEVCGMSRVVKDWLFRPSANCGVFGLSGVALCVPTLDRPEIICCTPVLTLLAVDGGG